MPELQQPDIAGNFLSSYYTAQQQQQAKQDRAMQQQRLAVQDERAAQQFDWLKDEQSYKQAMQRKEAIARAAFALDTPEKWAAGVPQVMQSLGIQGAAPGFDQRDRIIAEAQSIGDQIDQQWKAKEFALKQRATEADIRQSNASAALTAAQIDALKNKPRPGFDPVSGRREAPAGVQGKDYAEVAKFSTEADAAARIASTLQGVLPAIQKGWSGPDFGTRRTVAGALWAIPGSGPGKEIIDTYDQIDQAAKISGIEALKGIGGSDTERELLTAIQTGVNPELTQKENERRARGQIAAADIVSKKAQLASEWVNRYGSLQYAAPDGTTWQQFWPSYQKQAWADHRKREAEIAAAEKGGKGSASSVVDAADAIISKPRGR